MTSHRRNFLIFALVCFAIAAGLLLLYQTVYGDLFRSDVKRESTKSLGVTITRAEAAAIPQQQGAWANATAGYYCQSAYSSTARNNCAASGATGMAARWHWCSLVNSDRQYSFDAIENWVVANNAAGLRSIIGTTLKELPQDSPTTGGSCTTTSHASPSWVLTGVFNDDVDGVATPALQYPLGTYHLNYLDREAQAEIKNFVRLFEQWLQDFAWSNPAAYASIEAIETMFGEQDTGADLFDRTMYRCAYGGGVWNATNGTCSVTGTAVSNAAAVAWRDKFSKPLLDEWGAVAPSKPKFMVVSNAFSNPGIERSQVCAGCGSKNLIDYAHDQFGIGAISTGGGVDSGNGNGADTLGNEYVNWWNVLKMRYLTRLTGLEAGVMFTGDEGNSGCCDTEREFYWNAILAIDYGSTYVFNLASDMNAIRTTTGYAQGKLLHRLTSGNPTGQQISPMAGIWFRDTVGTYYPDGDNGLFGNPSIVRGEYPCCWNKPNFEWFILQNNWNIEQVVRRGSFPLPDTYRSLSARRTTATYPQLKMRVENNWGMFAQTPLYDGGCAVYDVTITYLDRGTDSWQFRYPGRGAITTHTHYKTNTGNWRSITFSITDWYLSDLINNVDSFWLGNHADGEDVFHSVTIQEVGGCFPVAPTPTPGPGTPTVPPGTPPTATPPGGGGGGGLPICTRAPGSLMEIPIIFTPTPTPTRTATPTATATATPTTTPTPS